MLVATCCAILLGPGHMSAAAQNPSWDEAIQPILDANCAGCHGADKQAGGLRLDTQDFALQGGNSGPALTPGNALESLIVHRVSLPPEHPDVMPPGDKAKLSASDIVTLMHWLTRAAAVETAQAAPAPEAPEATPAAGPDGTPWVDFASQIQPILSANCYQCHGEDRQRGGLRLDSPDDIDFGGDSGAVLAAGDPEGSLLLARVLLPADHPEFMPLNGDPLPDAEKDLIRRWIAQGASFEDRAVVTASVEEAAPSEVSPDPAPGFQPRPASNALVEIAKEVPPVDMAQLEPLQAIGALALPLAQDHPLVRVDFQRMNGPWDAGHLALLQDIAPHVTEVNLAKTGVTDEDLAALNGLEHITRINLAETAITDAGLEHLKGLEHLEYLNLYGTQVSDAGIGTLTGISSLRNVYLWQTNVTASGAERLREAIPGLFVEMGIEEPADATAK